MPSDLFDCNRCGACCSYLADWPQLTTARDRGPDGPPAHMVTEDGYMHCHGDRCSALVGEVGGRTGCSIYERRPQVCRDCTIESPSCLVARRAFGLVVPEQRSSLDDLFTPDGSSGSSAGNRRG